MTFRILAIKLATRLKVFLQFQYDEEMKGRHFPGGGKGVPPDPEVRLRERVQKVAHALEYISILSSWIYHNGNPLGCSVSVIAW